MDDYSLSSLSESKNEWCARLVNILTPAITEGLKSIYSEAFELCVQNDEEDKYLMTFQTLLSRIPKWNETMVDDERKRIENSTACTYLEDLITCVHIIQLKALTCVRVGQKQKKIDIDVPSTNSFIHKCYITIARKLYTNIYLFEIDIPPLEVQKRNRELELIVKESILNSIRDTMPVEAILRAYMDETEEQNVEIKDEVISEPLPVAAAPTESIPSPPISTSSFEKSTTETEVPNKESTNIVIKTDSEPEKSVLPAATLPEATLPEATLPEATLPEATLPVESVEPSPSTLSFTDIDNAIDETGIKSEISAPKNIERLEKLAEITAEKRRMEALEEDEERIKIGEEVKLEISDIANLQSSSIKLAPPVLDDIEVLG